MQVFKAQLSNRISITELQTKWREYPRSQVRVDFRLEGDTTLMATIYADSRWDPSGKAGSGGFCNVLQQAVHAVLPECAVLSCVEVNESRDSGGNEPCSPRPGTLRTPGGTSPDAGKPSVKNMAGSPRGVGGGTAHKKRRSGRGNDKRRNSAR